VSVEISPTRSACAVGVAPTVTDRAVTEPTVTNTGSGEGRHRSQRDEGRPPEISSGFRSEPPHNERPPRKGSGRRIWLPEKTTSSSFGVGVRPEHAVWGRPAARQTDCSDHSACL
jgi:hypothetical protein